MAHKFSIGVMPTSLAFREIITFDIEHLIADIYALSEVIYIKTHQSAMFLSSELYLDMAFNRKNQSKF